MEISFVEISPNLCKYSGFSRVFYTQPGRVRMGVMAIVQFTPGANANLPADFEIVS